MNTYIPYQELINYFGLYEEAINKGTLRYRKGTSSSWENVKDPKDERKVLINRNTIPSRTRKKYGILTTSELEEEKQQKRLKFSEILNDDRKTQYYELIEKALSTHYQSYLHLYEADYPNMDDRRNKAKIHSIYENVLKIYGFGMKGELSRLFEVYSLFDFKGKITKKETLCRHLKKAKNKGIKSLLIHKSIGQSRNLKFSPFHESLTIMYASEPVILSSRTITDMVNAHINRVENLKEVSQSTIEHFVCKKEIKNLIEQHRFGGKSFEKNIQPFLPRDREKYAGDMWVMDGTPLQFWCKDETGKRRRLNFYVIIDAFSGKVVGYDISISEDRFNVINALKMAFYFHNHLPSIILHDNFSANKTEELKLVKSKLEGLGTIFRAAKVGNAKDKTHVERFFGVCQTTVMKLFHDYMGEGIMSKRKEGRPDENFWKKAAKKGDLYIDEMKNRMTHVVKMYNNLSVNSRPSPISLYEVSPKPNARVLRVEQIPFVFWYRKSITIRRSMVMIKVKKQEYFYELPSNELKLRLNGEKVDVFYDEKDLDTIHLFTHERDNFICECRRYKSVIPSQVGVDDDATMIVIKGTSKN